MIKNHDNIKIYRKLWHMSAAWVPLVYYHMVNRYTAIVVVGIAVILALILDVARLTIPVVNEWFYKRLHMLIREGERKTFNTSTWFVIAVFLTIYFFEKKIAVIALLFLAFGDPIAAFIGSKYGTRRILNKSLQGSIACFVTCFVLAQMMFNLYIALWAALCATLFELLSSKINDNLSIPFFSGLAMTLLTKESAIPKPLYFIYVVFQVYLIFVIASFLLGVVLRHVIIWLYSRNYERAYTAIAYYPTISVIKPLKGLDDKCYENFTALCNQKYPAPYEIIFAVEDPADPVLEVVERLIRNFPEREIRIVHTPPHTKGRHGKIRNLIAGEEAARYEVIVVSDSDVRPSESYLARLVRPLQDPTVGMVTAIPTYFGAKNIPAALQSLITFFLGFSIYYPMAYMEKLDTAIGSTMALRRVVLDEVGGFKSVADHIADDHILAKELNERGYKIILANRPVHIHKERSTIKGWLSELHRRNVMFHTYEPQVYPFYLFQSGIFHAFLYWLLMGNQLSLTLLIVASVAEMLSFFILNLQYVQDRSTYWFLWLAVPLSLLGPLLWASPYFSSVVTWRGAKYYVARSGVVTQLDEH